MCMFYMCITDHFPGPVSNTYVANSFLPSDFDGYLWY